MKEVYIRKDRQERYNGKRAWFVNAWRIVDILGNDCIQPWCNTKKEVTTIIKQMGWKLKGEWGVANV